MPSTGTVEQSQVQEALENNKAVDVVVTTAVPMDDALRAKALAKAEELYHMPVTLQEEVDPNILGGIILDAPIGRYDMSVRVQLAAVRRSLASSGEGGA